MVGFNILFQIDSMEFGELVLFEPVRENNLIYMFIDPLLFCIGADSALV